MFVGDKMAVVLSFADVCSSYGCFLFFSFVGVYLSFKISMIIFVSIVCIRCIERIPVLEVISQMAAIFVLLHFTEKISVC